MTKIDKRGLWWKKISKEDRSEMLSKNRTKGWAKVNKEERTKIGIRMNEARWGKK